MKDRFCKDTNRKPKLCVSCQHYSFAVNAFVDVVNKYDADEYNFILRETQTGEIIDDVANNNSEIGVLFLSSQNEEVLTKLFKKNDLVFEEIFLSVLDMPKNIQVRDRATLFNLAIGLNGFTVSSGVIDKELNGEDIIAKPLNIDANMRIGLIKKKNIMLSRYALAYIEAIKKCVAID